MAQNDPSGDLERRVTALEEQVAQIQEQTTLSRADSEAARVLPAGADHDVSEVRAELRAHTSALNALRQSQVDLQRTVDGGFADVRAEMRTGFAEMRTGFAAITGLLETLAGDDEKQNLQQSPSQRGISPCIPRSFATVLAGDLSWPRRQASR